MPCNLAIDDRITDQRKLIRLRGLIHAEGRHTTDSAITIGRWLR
ncbi:hypothetical protein ACQP2T_30355 [Nonomuraea sp. CA-143628]